MGGYATWHLGLTDGANDKTKARYAFVYGDLRRVHRTGLIACVYRAAEWRHKDVDWPRTSCCSASTTSAADRRTGEARGGRVTAREVRAGRVVSPGGPIAMAGHPDGGVVSRLTGHDLLAGLGALSDGLDVEVHDLGARPSADLTFDDVLDAVDVAGQAVAGGARGIVLTQGTDTLEETAFLVDAVWAHDAPFVLTGAMRNPTLPGADGPANLSAALHVAGLGGGPGPRCAGRARQPGARRRTRPQVAQHQPGGVHLARPRAGRAGGRGRAAVPRRRAAQTDIGLSRERLAATTRRIALHLAAFDDDGATLDAVSASHQGLVVAGFSMATSPVRWPRHWAPSPSGCRWF